MRNTDNKQTVWQAVGVQEGVDNAHFHTVIGRRLPDCPLWSLPNEQEKVELLHKDKDRLLPTRDLSRIQSYQQAW